MKLLLSLTFSIVSLSLFSQINTLYVGGYTNGKSEGIYTFEFNCQTGALKNKALVAKANNPSYLILSEDKKTVYAVSELNKYLNSNSGAVSSYAVLEDGQLIKNAELSSQGTYPCHLALNEKADKLVVSNYGGGNFSMFSLENNGRISTLIQTVAFGNDSIKAHTHSAQFHKENLFVADLGTNSFEHLKQKDSIYYKHHSVSMSEKSGPRHFCMTKDAEYIYILNEYSASITTLKKEENQYKKLANTPTLRDNYEGENASADIHMTNNEKFIYASNRGENSIVVFERNKKDGSLKRIQSISCHGNWPRNFTIAPKENFLLVANKKSSNIAIFLIDKASGELTYIYDVKQPNPSCLAF